MLSTLTTGVYALTHGWSGFAFGYGAVAAPMVAGMIKGRARLQELLWSPVLAVPTMVVSGIATTALEPALHWLGAARGGLTEFVAGLGVCTAVGYVSGRVLAKSPSSRVSYGRGASIVDSAAGKADTSAERERATVRERERAWRKSDHRQA